MQLSHYRLFVQLAIVCLFGLLTAQAQQPEERIIKPELLPPDAIQVLEISNLQVDGKPAVLGQKFKANGDWVKKLTFDAKNISGKSIRYFEIGVQVTSPNGQSGNVSMISFGSNTTSSNTKQALSLLPNEISRAAYGDKNYQDFQDLCEHLNATKVNELTLAIEFVIFEDDTAWRHGLLMRRDSSNPTRWKVIGRESLLR